MKKSMLASLLGKTGEAKTFSLDSILGSVGAAGAGFGGTYGFNALAARFPAMQKSPAITPLVMGVTGHFLKRVSPAAGYALIGSAATIAAINAMTARAAQNAGEPTGAGRDDDDDDGANEASAGQAGALIDHGHAVTNAGALVDQGMARVEARGFASAGDAGLLID